MKAARLRSTQTRDIKGIIACFSPFSLPPCVRSFGFPSHWLIRGLWVGLPACLTPRRRGFSFSPDFPLSRALQDGQPVGRIRYFHPLGDPISKGLRKYSQVSFGTLFGEQRGLSLMKLVTSCFSGAFPRFRGHRRRGRRRKNKKFTADGHAIALSPIAVICAKRIRSAIPVFPHFPPSGGNFINQTLDDGLAERVLK